MNPLKYLRPAVYAALTTPALELAGESVPVLAYGATDATAYVLLPPAQDTASPTSASRSCKGWSCTLLVDVVTLNKTAELSVARADALAELVSERLDGVRLVLEGDMQISQATVEQVNGGESYDGEKVDIHRYLRLRYQVYYNAPAPALPGFPYAFPFAFAS